MAKAATMHLMVMTRSVSPEDRFGRNRISTCRSGGASGRPGGRRRRFFNDRRSRGSAWARIACDVRIVPRSQRQKPQYDNDGGRNQPNCLAACRAFPILTILHALLPVGSGENVVLLSWFRSIGQQSSQRTALYGLRLSSVFRKDVDVTPS